MCAGTDPSVFVFQRLDSVAEAPACCTCGWELEEGSLELGVAPGTDFPLDFATCSRWEHGGENAAEPQ